MKRKHQALRAAKGSVAASQLCFTKKQLRSRLARRPRLRFSPIIPEKCATSLLNVPSEVSVESSLSYVDDFRRAITARYYRKKSRNCVRVELSENMSENSCVESCSGMEVTGGSYRDLKLKSVNVEEEAAGEEISKSEVSSVSRCTLSENQSGNVDRKVTETEGYVGNDVLFENPCEFSPENINSEAVNVQTTNILILNDGMGSISNSAGTAIDASEKRESEELRSGAMNKIPELTTVEFDLACSEQFSNCGTSGDGEYEEQNSSSANSQVVSDFESESPDYTYSLWSYTSGSQFSEKSMGDENCSPTFQMLAQFKKQFCESTSVQGSAYGDCEDYSSNDINLLGLEDEDEESYKIIRKRERRQVYLRDYAEEYCSATEYGNLVIQQRQQMVHWIVEQATNKELQRETMFLGVSLLDRFLSKGYFKNIQNLQIAGIACLTLATRIEENQPNNCIRRKTFDVGSNTYARYEVVAMEWMVLEVLNFECYLPTLYNFLWFYLKAARANEKVEKTTKYLAVLALLGHQQLCYWPSTVAAGLVVLASIAANQDASCKLITEYFFPPESVRYAEAEVSDLVGHNPIPTILFKACHVVVVGARLFGA
ncbi:cyclin-SDS [Dorcoceras hygrometricum]|uniref:Cyclin-SDS n=1 Tax=Dorcoceras hygrometricum TaxID=472368 RepID=A0A2Z7ACT0_9LAMI|nr:cyclin-SDS [Dorcoceras hygrometricum]